MNADIIRAEHQYECPDCRSQVRATCEVNQDLLEVCKMVAAYADEIGHEPKHCNGRPCYWCAARATVAKAKGK